VTYIIPPFRRKTTQTLSRLDDLAPLIGQGAAFASTPRRAALFLSIAQFVEIDRGTS